jgi:regulator of sirC expression with transglutaminase-like and TPR domain
MTVLDSFALVAARIDVDAQALLRIAALLPQYADADFEPDAVVERVHGWGRELGARVAADASPLARLRLLNFYFFDELEFRGAEDDYDHVDNSYLHRVIERRCGIPITLSLLYMEIGQALGLRLQGVGFPGHFLVKLPVSNGAVMIDVYGRGITLDADALRERLARLRGEGEARALQNYLRPAADREIIARMLRNLKRLHARAEDWPSLLEVQHRLVALLPDVPEERRDRAQTYERLECPRAAAADLAAYLEQRLHAPDAPGVRAQLQRVQAAARSLN